MITLPYRVARMITLDNMHPVTAWRHYYGLSLKVLAEEAGVSEQALLLIEKSNQHLMHGTLVKLSAIFGIMPEALSIRHRSY